MTSLDPLWQFIAFRPGLNASGIEWRECLGEGLWESLRKRLFISDGIASKCRRSSDARTLQVVPAHGGYQLVCDATGNVVAMGVVENDVRCYRIDATATRNMIAEALGATAEPRRVRGLPRAFPLGEWRPMDAVAIPLFLMFPPTAERLTSEIQRLLVGPPHGFILLVPQPPRLDSAMRDQLEQKRAAVVPLPEVVTWDGEKFRATPVWDKHRDAYCTKHLADRMVPAQPEYQFARKGMWAIRFAGKETFLEGTLKGPMFIRYLLVHQGERIHVARVLADIAGDERLAQASNAGDAITPEEIARFRDRYAELQAAKEEASERNDEGQLAAIEKELGQMATLLEPLFGFGGKSRKANDDVARIRKAIARVIGTSLDKIAESDPVLEQHLRNTIKTHTYMSYEPETRIDWNFE